MKNRKNNVPSDRDVLFGMFAELLSLVSQLVNNNTLSVTCYDSSDVKILLKISDSTFYRWCREGKLVHKKVGGKIYVSKTSVDNLLK